MNRQRIGESLDYRAQIAASCWIAVAVIASVYMYVFSGKVGDVFFGVFFPVGLLVLVALIVTVVVTSKPEAGNSQQNSP